MDNNSLKKVVKILSILLAMSVVLSLVLTVLLINAKNVAIIDKRWKSESISSDDAAKDGIYIDKYMEEAINNAINNEGTGGPVGAVITKKDGELVVSTSNHNSLGNKLLHGEICALNDAMSLLKTKDLSDCVLYTSSEPCLMCAVAIASTGISKVYYAASFDDSKPYGFNDEEDYNRILEGDTLTEWVYVEKPNKIEQFKGWYQNRTKQAK